MSDKKLESKKKSGNKFLRFTGMASQMAITIIGFSLGGNELDKYQQNEKPIWTIVLSLTGIAIALYNVIRSVLKITNED